MTSSDLFIDAALPELVFEPPVTCAWVYFDDLCTDCGFRFLREIALSHGDAIIHAVGVDLYEPAPLAFDVNDIASYVRACDDDLWSADVVRWWGTSGRWGVDGSRGFEVAVVGQRPAGRWPRLDECKLLSIDAALRIAWARSPTKERMLAVYDELSWDPASEAVGAVERLLQTCDDAINDVIDPIVAIRRLLDELDVAPKNLRRMEATSGLHEAWGRTQYLLLGDARARWGSLLLEQNDRNHRRHAEEERQLVRDACIALRRSIRGG